MWIKRRGRRRYNYGRVCSNTSDCHQHCHDPLVKHYNLALGPQIGRISSWLSDLSDRPQHPGSQTYQTDHNTLALRQSTAGLVLYFADPSDWSHLSLQISRDPVNIQPVVSQIISSCRSSYIYFLLTHNILNQDKQKSLSLICLLAVADLTGQIWFEICRSVWRELGEVLMLIMLKAKLRQSVSFPCQLH